MLFANEKKVMVQSNTYKMRETIETFVIEFNHQMYEMFISSELASFKATT